MSGANQRPHIFILAETGLPGLSGFRANLRAALSERGLLGIRVSLLRPATNRGLERLAERTHAATRTVLPGVPDDDLWLPEADDISTDAQKKFSALRKAGTAPTAMVALVTTDFDDRKFDGEVEQMARWCLEFERDDLLIPVLLSGEPPTSNDPTLALRLLSATDFSDWRSDGIANQEQIGELADRLAAALAEPFVARREPAKPLLDVVRVDAAGSGDCRRVAEGMALARPGGRVEVLPGTYLESLELWKSVHLTGIGPRESIRIQSSFCALRTPERFPDGTGWRQPAGEQSPRITVENLTLEATNKDPWWLGTISLHAGRFTIRNCEIVARRGCAIRDHSVPEDRAPRSPAVIEHCVIRSGENGVQFSSSACFTIRDTRFIGQGEASIGVRLHSAGAGVIERCHFEGWQYAIVAGSPKPLRISRLSVEGGVTAVGASCNANVAIDRLSVSGSHHGLSGSGNAKVFVRGSAFTNCGEAICAHEQSSVTAWECTATGSVTVVGFRADGDATLLVAGSRVRGTKYGGWSSESAIMELLDCHISGCEMYGAGASDAASIAVRACTLEDSGDGIQFTDESSGEVVESRLHDNHRFAVASWSSGRVEAHSNGIRHGDTPFYAGPGSNLYSDTL